MFKKIRKKILNRLLKSEFNIKYNDLSELIKLKNKKIKVQNEVVDAKILNSGERQVAENVDGIRFDHVGRYNFATKYLNDGDNILDLACGVGYGSFLMSQDKDVKITSIDISQDAINYANKYYKNEKINFICSDCFEVSFENKIFDKIISFETIEHIKQDKRLLEMYNTILKEDGKLILSTPNELLMPFNKTTFPFHIKHYTPTELENILNECSFVIEEIYSQKTNQDQYLIDGWKGKFNIVVCKKNNKRVRHCYQRFFNIKSLLQKYIRNK